jgi:hypothetical protein
MVIGYITENNNILYDFDTMRRILRTSRSTLHRHIKKNNIEGTRYKNQFLYSEQSLFSMMELVLLEKLNNINGLQEDKRLNG